MVPSASHSVTINRSASEVFAFVADGEDAPRWRSGVLDIQRVSGHGVGAVYRQGVRGPAGRRITADYEVTAYQPNRAGGWGERGERSSALPQDPSRAPEIRCPFTPGVGFSGVTSHLTPVGVGCRQIHRLDRSQWHPACRADRDAAVLF
jgi:hypothetical protein